MEGYEYEVIKLIINDMKKYMNNIAKLQNDGKDYHCKFGIASANAGMCLGSIETLEETLSKFSKGGNDK